MNPFQEKYHQTKGTHCWFCDREFNGNDIRRTREHIIPKSKIIYSHPKNYIASCSDCNGIKKNMDAKRFAEYMGRIVLKNYPSYHFFKYCKIIRERAWKLYNKTSNLHRNYKKIRLA